MKIKIVDNFLDDNEANIIEKVMTRQNFPWIFRDHLNEPVQNVQFWDYVEDSGFASSFELSSESLNNYYFAHNVVQDGKPCSDYLDLFTPIMAKIPVENPEFTRIKANLYTRTEKRVLHKKHQDYNPGKEFTCLYYVNTNDRYTLIDGKRKIESKKNRIAFFDGSIPHQSTTPTNTTYGCSVNFSCISPTIPSMDYFDSIDI